MKSGLFGRGRWIRRLALVLLGLGPPLAILGMSHALAEDAVRPETACPGAFPAPKLPMLLSRQLRRRLFDGKEVVVTRKYRVSFVESAEGFRVDGKLIGTDVEVPERLAGLAKLEKARPDTSTFPILLDHNGLIMPGNEQVSAALPGQIRAQSGPLIAGTRLPALAREADALVSRLFTAGGEAMTQWPEALFRPSGGPQVYRSTLALPGDQTGLVVITLKSRASQPCAVFERVERLIETEVGADHRRTEEIWTLQALP